ncbi:unnamed protein product [Ostreobium quekettii]|uniref:Protein kinase domain-containing protein n=1 Tax=Ostreobium quekettii TaxID=121088 RepID=A0A8S1J8S8_9CHLO|nr:unnamed protein product [Ostreobium quekettii]
MAYVDGCSLDDLIETQGPLNEDHARYIFQQKVLIIDCLHVHYNIMHRDLKLSNFIAWRKKSEEGMVTVSLCDFGWAKQSGSGGPTVTKTGTRRYIAPEVLNSPADTWYDGKAADMYSLGVCLFKMIFAQFPRTQDEDIVPAGVVSPQCAQLLRRLLQPNPAQRITLDELWADPWFDDEFRAMRQYNEDRMAEAESRIVEQSEEDVADLIKEMWGVPAQN